MLNKCYYNICTEILFLILLVDATSYTFIRWNMLITIALKRYSKVIMNIDNQTYDEGLLNCVTNLWLKRYIFNKTIKLNFSYVTLNNIVLCVIMRDDSGFESYIFHLRTSIHCSNNLYTFVHTIKQSVCNYYYI